MPRLLRITFLLGATPLLSGLLIYATWRFTRWHELELAGLLTLLAGLVSVSIGSIVLIRHLRNEAGVRGKLRGAVWRQGALAGGLLFANFPVAAICILSAHEVATRYTMIVFNESSLPVEHLIITGPGISAELGPIAPGEHVRKHFHFSGEGSVEFSARQQATQSTGLLEGYVSGGNGGGKILRIKPGGGFELQPHTN